MTDSSYYLAWLIYITACAGVCFMTWKLLKPWTVISAKYVVIPLLIVLLTPYISDPGQTRLAPAILTGLFEGIFGDMQVAIKALSAIAVLLIFGLFIIFMLRLKKSRTRINRLQ